MLDFNEAMKSAIQEIIGSLEEFKHINLKRVRISATYARSTRRAGLLAYVLPLKYKNGSPTQVKMRGKAKYHFGIVPTYHEGEEILYILYFMLPRFLNLPYRDKLETIIHELYHISPDFNGDLRRLKGRSYIHGNSLKEYEENIKRLTDRFMESSYNELAFEFLAFGAKKLENFYGTLVSSHTPEPRPKLIHVE